MRHRPTTGVFWSVFVLYGSSLYYSHLISHAHAHYCPVTVMLLTWLQCVPVNLSCSVDVPKVRWILSGFISTEESHCLYV